MTPKEANIRFCPFPLPLLGICQAFMIFSSETCNLPYHCGQQIRQNPSVSSTMLAVTPPLGEKRKVYSFEFEKNKKMEKFGKKQNTKQLERYSFGISQSRPSSWQSLGKSYFSILHRYS